jgi:UDP-glucose 4-epimerase
MGMRVVVTGAGGFIGRRLVNRLVREQVDVFAVDRVAPFLRVPGVRYLTYDLETSDLVVPAQWKEGPAFSLVHLAWNMQRNAPREVQDHQADWLVRLIKAGPSKVVAMGSAAEYGSRGGSIREEDPAVDPVSLYGQAKQQAFLEGAAVADRKGIGFVWLRPFVAFGPGQSGDMAIPYAIRQVLAGQPALFTDGSQSRDFVYVDDVVEAILLALKAQFKGPQVFNIACGEAVAVRDVLQELARLMDAEDLFRLGVIPRRPGEPDVQIAVIRRAQELLLWNPSIQWRKGLEMICACVKR